MTISIRKYCGALKSDWDRFISISKNGTFLFYRDYMEYHADRYADFSLMFYDDDCLVGVLPATTEEKKITSHGGLTFGGIVSDQRMHSATMLAIFKALKGYLQEQGMHFLLYKAIPHIYTDMPAEEDLYALHYVGAKLYRRDVSSCIALNNRLKLSKGRKWMISRAKKLALSVRHVNDYRTFMAIEEENLIKNHGVRPVHSAEEIELLAIRFPENIKLFASYKDEVMMGGVIIYESRHVAHTQYIAATEAGRKMGATDIIINYLINEYYTGKKYFDFGISTEAEGRKLNVGLVQNKEGFGGRAIVHDHYEVDLSK